MVGVATRERTRCIGEWAGWCAEDICHCMMKPQYWLALWTACINDVHQCNVAQHVQMLCMCLPRPHLKDYSTL